MTLISLLLWACTPKSPADSPGDDSPVDSVVESPPDSPVDTGYPAELHGEIPETSIPAPTFAALSHDGSARGREDLLGHRTVVWFFPAADTFG